MDVLRPAIAGTLESSDIQVMIEPGNGSINLELESVVMNQYGRQIRETVMEVLKRLEVTSANIRLIDRGALDCTIKARVECAVFRSCGRSGQNVPWGGAIR